MRFTLNIPFLRQFGVIPRFDGYACQVLLPLLVFLSVCCFIIFSLHGEESASHSERHVAYTASATAPVSPAVVVEVDDELHYGVMVDCGSSGSRVYIYCWPPHSGHTDELLHIRPVRDQNGKPFIKKIEPGISSHANKPSSSAEYLRPLLDYAMEAVPSSKHKETPLYIYATAGMRMLPTRDQEEILSDIRSDVPLWYDFLFQESHTEVISGRQEAIYAWISINYGLGRFDHTTGAPVTEHLSLVEVSGPDPTTHVRKQTVGMLDMGGGSLQVAFEVPHSVRFELPKEEAAKGLVTEFSLGCTKNDIEHTYRLYTTTYLSFGSNSARKQYEQTLFNNISTTANASHTGSQVVLDPCLPVKFREQISSTSGDQMLTLEGTGNFHECHARLKSQLNLSSFCLKEPCTMNGVFQPEIDFDHSEFYGFSEFFYTMEDLLQIGGPYSYRQFLSKAREFCAREWNELEDWQNDKRYPRADHNRYRLQCFKSAWMSMILHDGLGFPTRYKHLTSVQYIKGEEIHWSLGALLYKTKFYPLRELERHETHNYRPPWRLVQHSHYLVIVCVCIVLAAILVYVRRLRVWSGSDIRRVPTMSYFMTEEGQAQDGLLNVDSYSTAASASEKYYSYS